MMIDFVSAAKEPHTGSSVVEILLNHLLTWLQQHLRTGYTWDTDTLENFGAFMTEHFMTHHWGKKTNRSLNG